MRYTSAESNKLLRKLSDEYNMLLDREEKCRCFSAAVGEDPESVRSEYDYVGTQLRLAELEGEIRRLKHAVNTFNLMHTVPGFDMTVDEMLVYLPQLSRRVQKLRDMKSRLPKERAVQNIFNDKSAFIDYVYTNYDARVAEADYEKAADKLSRAQLALDAVNNGETFDFEI